MYPDNRANSNPAWNEKKLSEPLGKKLPIKASPTEKGMVTKWA